MAAVEFTFGSSNLTLFVELTSVAGSYLSKVLQLTLLAIMEQLTRGGLYAVGWR